MLDRIHLQQQRHMAPAGDGHSSPLFIFTSDPKVSLHPGTWLCQWDRLLPTPEVAPWFRFVSPLLHRPSLHPCATCLPSVSKSFILSHSRSLLVSSFLSSFGKHLLGTRSGQTPFPGCPHATQSGPGLAWISASGRRSGREVVITGATCVTTGSAGWETPVEQWGLGRASLGTWWTSR